MLAGVEDNDVGFSGIRKRSACSRRPHCSYNERFR